jgi:hypothetical protein
MHFHFPLSVLKGWEVFFVTFVCFLLTAICWSKAKWEGLSYVSPDGRDSLPSGRWSAAEEAGVDPYAVNHMVLGQCHHPHRQHQHSVM